MKVDPETHLFSEARFVASPNVDERPAGEQQPGADINLLVIHNISLPPAEFGGPYIEDFFCNRLDVRAHEYFEEIVDLRVSSHLLIRRDGELVQFVPFDQRAWHAGVSSYEGRDKCNDFSIGIELEGTDELPYEEVQYEVLADVIMALFDAYPALNRDRITGHCSISPGRKTDPGPAFNWAHLQGMLDSLQTA